MIQWECWTICALISLPCCSQLASLLVLFQPTLPRRQSWWISPRPSLVRSKQTRKCTIVKRWRSTQTPAMIQAQCWKLAVLAIHYKFQASDYTSRKKRQIQAISLNKVNFTLLTRMVVSSLGNLRMTFMLCFLHQSKTFFSCPRSPSDRAKRSSARTRATTSRGSQDRETFGERE